MKIILNKLLTLFLFLLALGCFYIAITMTFVTSFINLALFFVAIFFLIQACGMFDKIQGYGQYSDNKDNNENETETEPQQNDNGNENDDLFEQSDQGNNFLEDDYRGDFD